uniref:Uncharacterized protein n=1 Tax=Aegilops tauschii subsp. strangulata TaxID=200361 RepID=A0A453E007_AEGTS
MHEQTSACYYACIYMLCDMFVKYCIIELVYPINCCNGDLSI